MSSGCDSSAAPMRARPCACAGSRRASAAARGRAPTRWITKAINTSGEERRHRHGQRRRRDRHGVSAATAPVVARRRGAAARLRRAPVRPAGTAGSPAPARNRSVPAVLLERRLPRLRCAAMRATRSVSASRSASERPGGATTARQLARSSAMPDSRSVGASMPAMRAGDGDGQRAQLAGGDLSGELAVAADGGRDLAAEHRGQRGAAARERDVVDARGAAGPVARPSAARADRRCRRPIRRPTTTAPGSALKARRADRASIGTGSPRARRSLRFRR